MLRICHIVSGDLWAGAEVMARNLLKGLKSYDQLELSAILLNEGRLAEEISRLGIVVHIVDESKAHLFNILAVVRKILRGRPPDLIHSHRYKENILAHLISRSFCGLKLIGTQHGMQEMHVGKTKLKNQFVSRWNLFVLSRYFHRVVGVSQDIRNIFVGRHGFREEKVSVIPNGIEIPPTTPKRYKPDTFIIGSAGRLYPVKDYAFMVETAMKVLTKINNISFELAGDGPERFKLQALVQKYGLEGSFSLRCHIEDISAFYRDLDLYINTSIYEGIPMSILEAMSHGLPVIAPRVGGISEIIEDGVQGYLVSERNPEAFAEKCLLLAANKELRRKMSQAAREKIVRDFSIERMAQQYYNLYHAIS